MDFIRKMQQFMYGRYGIDDLTKFILKIYLVIIVCNIFIKSFILTVAELLLLIICIFRTLSKKIYNRNSENMKYKNICKSISKPFNNIKRNIKDKDKVYKRCHKCHTILKLPVPKRRGIKHSTCPKCKKRNTFLILKQQKIEIISKKG